jgi:hypothetical protein
MSKQITFLDESEFQKLVDYQETYPPGSHLEAPPQHVLEFDHIPSNNELRLVAEATLTKPYRVTGYRYVAQTQDKLKYLIEEVDIDKEFKQQRITPSEFTITVTVSYHCENCGEAYSGWRIMNRNHFDDKHYYYTTQHCPKCPPVSVEMWLAQIGVLTEKPEDYTRPSKRRSYTYTPPEPALTLSEMDDFE